MIKKILCVDDDEIDLLIMGATINQLLPNVRIETAGDGKAALDYFDTMKKESGVPDVLLLDLNMPDMDGWQFLDEFDGKYKNEFSDMFIAILSSSIIKSDFVKAEEHPRVSMFISKPLTQQAVKKIMENFRS